MVDKQCLSDVCEHMQGFALYSNIEQCSISTLRCNILGSSWRFPFVRFDLLSDEVLVTSGDIYSMLKY